MRKFLITRRICRVAGCTPAAHSYSYADVPVQSELGTMSVGRDEADSQRMDQRVLPIRKLTLGVGTAEWCSRHRAWDLWLRGLGLRNPERPRKAEIDGAALWTSLGRILVVVLEESYQILRGEDEIGLQTNSVD